MWAAVVAGFRGIWTNGQTDGVKSQDVWHYPRIIRTHRRWIELAGFGCSDYDDGDDETTGWMDCKRDSAIMNEATAVVWKLSSGWLHTNRMTNADHKLTPLNVMANYCTESVSCPESSIHEICINEAHQECVNVSKFTCKLALVFSFQLIITMLLIRRRRTGEIFFPRWDRFINSSSYVKTWISH